MALTWSSRRKALYGSVVVCLLAAFLITIYLQFFNNPSTCFDGALNSNEHGIDCGGSCALVCKEEALSLIVLWSRAFEVAPHTYTAAAYVQNPNVGAGAKSVPYSFQLFDEKNSLIVERVGVINIPPVQTTPFIDPNIDVGNRVVARALFAFSEVPVWNRISNMPQLRIGNQYLAANGTLLSATISNESVQHADQVIVAAVLFDGNGIARAASRSILARIPRKGSQDVVFTWPNGVKDVMRAEITVLPSF